MVDSPSHDFEVRRQLAQMQSLYEVGLALGESLDPAHVAQEILQRALSMVDARAGALLVRGGTDGVITAGQVNLDDGACRGLQDLQAGWQAASALQVESLAAVGRHVALVPLRSQGEVHGLLAVVDKETRGGVAAFSEADLALLDSFGLQAGSALRNARLHRDLQAAFDSLQAAQERIVHLEQLRALGDLAGELAHGMRHIMGLVIGHADAWLTLGGDPRTAMEAILSAAEGGQQLIDRIHRCTRLGVGRERTQEDLNLVVGQAIAQAQALTAPDAVVVWDVSLTPNLPPTWLNRDDIVEALVNLLENALTAVGATGRIGVRTASDDAGFEVCVRDDGPGIADAIHERIFEPFVSTRGDAGSGLGLSIVDRIVEAHGGGIEVDTGRDGTIFTVRLPRVAEAPPVDETQATMADDDEEDPDRR